MVCQICKSEDLAKVLDLGLHPPPLKFLDTIADFEREELFPLKLIFCNSCKLLQLEKVIDPNIMFKNYLYTSAISTSFRNHLYNFADLLLKKFNLNSQDLIIDIGSNDGTLLEKFLKKGVKVLGVEPSNTAKIAINKGIETINNFFSEETAIKIRSDYGKAKVVTATNVFAHVDKLEFFIKGMKMILAENGVFVSESQYLMDIFDKQEYDTIYHEHLRYYSLEQLIKLFRLHDMEVFFAERILAQGGSIRAYASFKNQFPIDKSVNELLRKEKEAKLSYLQTAKNFASRIKQNKLDLCNLLSKLKSQGKKIVGISAPARSSTILNYCKIDSKMLDYITEKSELKKGKFTPGTHIKVVDDEMLKTDQPDYALLLSWHLEDNIIQKIKNKGFKGKFIIPLPIVKVI